MIRQLALALAVTLASPPNVLAFSTEAKKSAAAANQTQQILSAIKLASTNEPVSFQSQQLASACKYAGLNVVTEAIYRRAISDQTKETGGISGAQLPWLCLLAGELENSVRFSEAHAQAEAINRIIDAYYPTLAFSDFQFLMRWLQEGKTRDPEAIASVYEHLLAAAAKPDLDTDARKVDVITAARDFYSFTKDTSRADALNAALEKAVPSAAGFRRPWVLESVADYKAHHRQYTDALPLYKQAFQGKQQEPNVHIDRRGTVYTLEKAGECYLGLADNARAQESFRQCIDAWQKQLLAAPPPHQPTPDSQAAFNAHMQLAKMFSVMNKSQATEREYESAIALAENINGSRDYSLYEPLTQLALFFDHEHKFARANDLRDRARQLAPEKTLAQERQDKELELESLKLEISNGLADKNYDKVRQNTEQLLGSASDLGVVHRNASAFIAIHRALLAGARVEDAKMLWHKFMAALLPENTWATVPAIVEEAVASKAERNGDLSRLQKAADVIDARLRASGATAESTSMQFLKDLASCYQTNGETEVAACLLTFVEQPTKQPPP